MRPAYDSPTAQILGVIAEEDVREFRSDFKLKDPLSFWHECVHWFQRKSLLGYSLNNLLLRAYCAADPKKKQQFYAKYLFCLRVLGPYAEGTAIFAQYDYFPSNYFIGVGEHNYLDELFTLFVANRFSFQQGDYDENELAQLSLDYLSTFRLNGNTVRKKRGLMAIPILVRQKHQLGYLFVKLVVSHIKRFPRFHYVHDGAILSGLIYYVFEYHDLIDLVNDDDCVGSAFNTLFAGKLAHRLSKLLDPQQVGQIFWSYRRAGGNHTAQEMLAIDGEKHSESERKYNEMYNWVYEFKFVESVARYMNFGESLDEYLERREPLSPLPVDAFQVLHGLDAVRFGMMPARLIRASDREYLEFHGCNERIDLEQIGATSHRAQKYGWIKPPPPDGEVCLKEVLFFLDHRLFHVTTVDFPHGSMKITCQPDDYNIGHILVGAYLQNSFEIDSILDSCRSECRLVSKEGHYSFPESAEVFDVYARAATEIDQFLPRTPNRRPLDLFESDDQIVAYIIYSLIQPILSFADENEKTIHARIDRLLCKFHPLAPDARTVKAFTRKGTPFAFSQKYNGRKVWWSSGTYL